MMWTELKAVERFLYKWRKNEVILVQEDRSDFANLQAWKIKWLIFHERVVILT